MFQLHADAVFALTTASPLGTLLAYFYPNKVFSQNQKVFVVNHDNDESQHFTLTIHTCHKHPCFYNDSHCTEPLVFSPDGTRLAVVANDRVYVAFLDRSKAVRAVKPRDGHVTGIAWDDEGRLRVGTTKSFSTFDVNVLGGVRRISYERVPGVCLPTSTHDIVRSNMPLETGERGRHLIPWRVFLRRNGVSEWEPWPNDLWREDSFHARHIHEATRGTIVVSVFHSAYKHILNLPTMAVADLPPETSSIAISPDGRRVVSFDGEVRLTLFEEPKCKWIISEFTPDVPGTPLRVLCTGPHVALAFLREDKTVGFQFYSWM